METQMAYAMNQEQFGEMEEGFPTNCNVLRLRGLPYSCIEEDVREFFKGFELKDPDAVLVISHGMQKGEGYVCFQTADICAEAHRKLHRQHIGERYVELYASSEQTMETVKMQLHAPGNGNFIVRMRGLPFQCDKPDILHFLADVPVTQIYNIELCLTYDGRNTGDAFVEVTTQDAFNKATSHNRQLIGQRYIEIFESNPRERETWIATAQRGGRGRGRGLPLYGMWPTPRGGRGGASGRGGRGVGPYATQPYVSNPLQMMMFMQQLQQQQLQQQMVRPRCVVRVRGLPFNITEEDVANFFGDVQIPAQGVHMVYNAQDRPTGEAFIEMNTEQDVQGALQHNGMALGHRYIEVFRSSVSDMNKLSGGAMMPDTTNMDPFDPNTMLMMMQMMQWGGANNPPPTHNPYHHQ